MGTSSGKHLPLHTQPLRLASCSSAPKPGCVVEGSLARQQGVQARAKVCVGDILHALSPALRHLPMPAGTAGAARRHAACRGPRRRPARWGKQRPSAEQPCRAAAGAHLNGVGVDGGLVGDEVHAALALLLLRERKESTTEKAGVLAAWRQHGGSTPGSHAPWHAGRCGGWCQHFWHGCRPGCLPGFGLPTRLLAGPGTQQRSRLVQPGLARRPQGGLSSNAALVTSQLPPPMLPCGERLAAAGASWLRSCQWASRLALPSGVPVWGCHAKSCQGSKKLAP